MSIVTDGYPEIDELDRVNQPSVETLVSLLYRTGAVFRGGPVVIASDPFGFWAEACSVVKLPCIVHVVNNPPAHISEKLELIANMPASSL